MLKIIWWKELRSPSRKYTDRVTLAWLVNYVYVRQVLLRNIAIEAADLLPNYSRYSSSTVERVLGWSLILSSAYRFQIFQPSQTCRFKIKRTKEIIRRIMHTCQTKRIRRDNRTRIDRQRASSFDSRVEEEVAAATVWWSIRVETRIANGQHVDESFQCPQEVVLFFFFFFFKLLYSTIHRNRWHLLPSNRILFQPYVDIISTKTRINEIILLEYVYIFLLNFVKKKRVIRLWKGGDIEVMWQFD